MPHSVRNFGLISGRMKCRSFLHNKTKINFISSDNPVVFFPKRHDLAGKPEPFNVENDDEFVLIFPVTPKIVQYYDSSEQIRDQHRKVWSEKTVLKINRQIAFFADRHVIGMDSNSIKVAREFLNLAPVPDFDKSFVYPEGNHMIRYKMGTPIKMPKWEYSFSNALLQK